MGACAVRERVVGGACVESRGPLERRCARPWRSCRGLDGRGLGGRGLGREILLSSLGGELQLFGRGELSKQLRLVRR